MANQLSKTNISNNNTIEAWQISQSVDAFTGTSAYDITISGSLIITGSTNIKGITNISGGLIITGSTSSVSFPGYSNATSSWATNVVTPPSIINGYMVPSGSTLTVFPIKLLAGYGEIPSGSTSCTITVSPAIIAGGLGTDVFVSVGISSSYSTGSMTNFPRVASLLAGNLTFSTQTAPSAAVPFFFTIMYK